MSSKVKPAELAKPFLKASKNTDVEKIHVTRATTTSMQGAPAWSTTPALQSANAVWNQKADALEANAKSITDLKSKLKTAIADQRVIRRDWTVATQHMIATVAIQCMGSAEEAQALGFDVVSRTSAGPLPPPEGLATAPGKALGTAVFEWKRGSARHGFIVQSAADVANPATYSAPVPCTRSKYTLKGAQSLSVVHFRVAAIDPIVEAGHSEWSTWVAGTVR